MKQLHCTLFQGNLTETMVLTATKVIDGRDHLLGRLCSIVSKELLAGQTIVIVRCDEICISGSCMLTHIIVITFTFL